MLVAKIKQKTRQFQKAQRTYDLFAFIFGFSVGLNIMLIIVYVL